MVFPRCFLLAVRDLNSTQPMPIHGHRRADAETHYLKTALLREDRTTDTIVPLYIYFSGLRERITIFSKLQKRLKLMILHVVGYIYFHIIKRIETTIIIIIRRD